MEPASLPAPDQSVEPVKPPVEQIDETRYRIGKVTLDKKTREIRFPAKVNLIPFNPHEGAGFEAPEERSVEALCGLLAGRGIPVSVRRSRGQDVAGACGQLVREGRPHPKA